MSEKALSGLEPRLQKQAEKIKAALGRGDDRYVVDVALAFLENELASFDVRRWLRTAQRRLAGGLRGFGGLIRSTGRLGTSL
jgi:KaiC/GvpD/RAD55 family RecA-like ATPase